MVGSVSRRSLFAAILAGAALGVGLFWVDSQMIERVGMVEIGIAFGPALEDDARTTATTTNPQSVVSTTIPQADAPSQPPTTLATTTTTQVLVTLPENINQSWRDEVLFLTNTERLKEGLEPLASCNNLHVAAQSHSFAMNEQNFFEHDNPNTGDDPATRADEAGYGMYVGENIAMGHQTPKQVVRAWMNSSGHRANILGSYSHLGVGITRGGSGTYGDGDWFYWVQNFGSGGECG